MKYLLDVPLVLLNCAHPPKQLWAIGEIGPERKVSIVGTRRPSREGLQIASGLANALAGRGITVVSGLAMGIDAAAHVGALDAGGKTIAVLPGGIESIYPAVHTNLAKTIVQSGGALVSEHDKTYQPKPYDFLARNRIIAGLSELVIVVEAPVRSGSLNTARHALEMGIDVAAIPGSIFAPNSVGTNQLIKMGCLPITATADVFEYLNISIEEQIEMALYEPHLKDLVLAIKAGASSSEELAKTLQKPPHVIEQMISELEIGGFIVRRPGNLLVLRG